MKQVRQRNAHSAIFGVLIAAMIGGCASYTKVNYPKTASPTEELALLEGELDRGVTEQQDILAPKEFGRAQKHLKEAKEELAQGDLDDFWDEMGVSRGYFNRSTELSAERRPRVAEVLKTRQAAIDSGARTFRETRNELAALDDSFKKNAKSLDYKNIDEEIWERATIDYAALRINAIREAHVGEAQELIKAARKKNARFYAPKALDQAETALSNAERAIADHPDDVAAFQKQANHANIMARNLIAVNATARRAAGQSNEEVANEIVGRNRTIAGLKSEVEGADLEAAMTTRELRAKEMRLRGLAAANRGLRTEQQWNEAIEEAREEFNEDEADVYRQGDKLLIRLKKINFPTGGTQVPESSKALLGKVSSVIEELNAKNVEIQGHTDSTGSAEINKKISKERAQAVAEYLGDEVDGVKLKSVGYGYERPITANKSPTGRAVNRRVDIVITPAGPDSE